MPAPKALAFLPKPLLFGLYGGIGGLLGALLFGELLYWLFTPPAPPPSGPVAQVAVATSPEVEVFVEGRNTFPVQIARDGFTGPVTVKLDSLPPGLSAVPVTIAEGKTEGEVIVTGARGARVGSGNAKVIAEATHEGKPVVAETPIAFKVTDPPRPLADIVFVLDVTNSMQWAIDDLKNGIGKFADGLSKARIDFRLGLVTFQDITNPGERIAIIEFKGDQFTNDPAVFRDEVSLLRATGGGDIPESSLEALGEASKMPFRKDAIKVMLLITDAPPKVPNEAQTAMAVRNTATRIETANIDSVHTVVSRFDETTYQPLTLAGTDKKNSGRYFDLGDVVRGDTGFDELFDTFGSVVSAAAIAKNPASKPQVSTRADAPKLSVKSLQSGEQSAAGTEGKVVLRSAVWTGAIAALVCFALLAGQHHYLRGSLPATGGIIAGLLGGLVVGAIGGIAGQGLYFLAPDSRVLAILFRVFGWAILGGLAGVGLSLFIPNMKWTLGLAGGAIGGAAGAIGFIAVSSVTGDLVGRLVGGLILGFSIGLMVAVAEAAFRRAWLEVRYGSRETIAVTLGPEPVKVGSDAKACTVWARGAPPIALRFFVRDGQVICDDAMAKREVAVNDGFAKEVGNLTVTVRTGSGAPTPPAPPPRPQPAASQAKKPLSLDDDDGFDLPMPIAPSSAPPASVPAKPQATAPKPPAPSPKPPVPPAPATAKPAVPPRPPAPVPPPPAKPNIAPAIKPTAKNPDACPGCSRVIPGNPGSRYCMICDQTF